MAQQKQNVLRKQISRGIHASLCKWPNHTKTKWSTGDYGSSPSESEEFEPPRSAQMRPCRLGDSADDPAVSVLFGVRDGFWAQHGCFWVLKKVAVPAMETGRKSLFQDCWKERRKSQKSLFQCLFWGSLQVATGDLQSLWSSCSRIDFHMQETSPTGDECFFPLTSIQQLYTSNH